jgi:uncharacterized protein YjbJ (UPF0337 family)
MGLAHRIRATVDQAAGSAKAKIGAVTDNHALQAEGLAQNAVGHAKQSEADPRSLEDKAQENIEAVTGASPRESPPESRIAENRSSA